VSETTVSKRLRQKGIDINQTPLRRSKISRAKIVALTEEGYSPEQIAEKADLHPATIRYHLRKHLER